MTYHQALDFLYTSTPMFSRVGAKAYKPGLDTTLALAAAFANPHHHLSGKTIHIAGTNGKGSTAHSLAAVLTRSGYRTGLFTSPHLVDFRERIRIDSAMIDRDSVVSFVRRYLSMNLGLHPSFFELTTIMALDHFARSSVDIAVIETGLGGRLDSTNIITPCLSIITNISLDHTALLGNTPAAIATEKAGIIKPRVPVVIGEADDPAVRHIFEEKARRCQAPVTFATDNPTYRSFEDTPTGSITYHGTPWGTITCDLAGNCQPRNTNTILTALSLLQPRLSHITAPTIAAGLATVTATTGLRGRWETIGRHPLTIIDTGHNPGGWQYLARQISTTPAATRHIIFGMAADKDIPAVIRQLATIPSARFYLTAPSSPRALPADDLARLAAAHALVATTCPDVHTALAAAQEAATPDDLIFIGGSNFIIADLLSGQR